MAAPSPIRLVELLHRALTAPVQHGSLLNKAIDATWIELTNLLKHQSPSIISVSNGQLLYQKTLLEGTPNASMHLAREIERRNIKSITFLAGIDREELNALLFALQLHPERLHEMGGAMSLLPNDTCIRIQESQESSPLILTPTGPLPPLPQFDTQRLEPPNSVDLEEDFRNLFSSTLRLTNTLAADMQGIPWSMAERNALMQAGFKVPDFSSFAGMEQSLGLSRLDPVSVREAIWKAVAKFSPKDLGSILLGLKGLPEEEMETLRAMEYLAPEFLSRTLWDVHQRTLPSAQGLAPLGAALIRTLKDRELAIDVLLERLLYGGWNKEDVETFHKAILSHLQSGEANDKRELVDYFEMPPHQATALVRRILRAERWADLGALLDQFRKAFLNKGEARRRQVALRLANLVAKVDNKRLPEELEQRLWTLTKFHMDRENDQPTYLWACRVLESLFSHWIQMARFQDASREMAVLRDVSTFAVKTTPWKAEAIQDALARVASTPNLAMLEVVLQRHKNPSPVVTQIHSLFEILGRPAAAYLVVSLELEEDRSRRQHLIAAIRAIGHPAVPALRNALGSPFWYLVRNAAQLLGEIGDKSAIQDLLLALEHRDLRVRKAAEKALMCLRPI